MQQQCMCLTIQLFCAGQVIRECSVQIMEFDQLALHRLSVMTSPYFLSTEEVPPVPSNIHALQLTDADVRTSPILSIVNTVATFSLGNDQIEARVISSRLPGVAYDPDSFAAAKYRNDDVVALLFSRGAAVCPGANGVEMARLMSRKFALNLLRSGLLVSHQNFRVRNIVCSVHVNFEIDLQAIKTHYELEAEYTNGKFPGIIFHMTSPKVVFIVFVPGSCIVTGVERYRDSELCWAWFYVNVLLRHKKGRASTKTNSAAYRRMLLRQDDFPSDCLALARRNTRQFSDALISIVAADIRRFIDDDDEQAVLKYAASAVRTLDASNFLPGPADDARAPAFRPRSE